MDSTVNYSIVRATLADAQMLSQLGARLFEETFRGTCTDDDMAGQLELVYNLRQVQSELADPDDYFFLLKMNRETLGYSRLKQGVPPTGVLLNHLNQTVRGIELKRMYLDKAVHGQGLAQQLMQYNLAHAETLGFTRVYLSVWEHNERAKAFYTKMGFCNTGIANPFPIGQTPQTDLWFVRDL